jgi:hypothetical protein
MRHYMYVHAFTRALITLSIINFFGGIASLLFMPPWILSICIMTSALFMISTRWSTSRRYLVDKENFRVPLHLGISNFLVFHMGWLNAVNMIVAAAIYFVLYFSLDGIRYWVAFFFMYATTAIVLATAIKFLLKYQIDSHFRIVVFRRNAEGNAVSHKAAVLPICGLYGQVLLLADDTLSRAWEGGWRRLAQWVVSEIYQPMFVDPASSDWRVVVLFELSYADFVVLDWPGEISENMLWELEQALERMPPERILLLTSDQGVFEQASQRLVGRAGFDKINVSISPTHPMGAALFTSGIANMMTSLRMSPRPPHPDTDGHIDILRAENLEAGPDRLPEGSAELR